MCRPEHLPAGPSAAAEAGQVPGGRADPRPAQHLRQREAGGLHPLLREPQRVCERARAQARGQHPQNEAAHLHADGREQE